MRRRGFSCKSSPRGLKSPATDILRRRCIVPDSVAASSYYLYRVSSSSALPTQLTPAKTI